jgi:hypothetical protein
MSDTILGMPKKVAIIGGAVAAGIVGYAWYKNGDSGAPVSAVDAENPAAVDEYDSPLGNSGTNSTATSSGNVDPDAINTNAKWTQAAVETLQGAGWDATAVFSALGKLLAFKTLSATEADIAQAAKAAQGEPPVGGPYPIKEGLPVPSPSTNPTKVTGLRVTSSGKTTIGLDWASNPGARGYKLFVNGTQNGSSVLYSTGSVRYLKAGTKYTIGVAAIYPGDIVGPTATITATTKK